MPGSLNFKRSPAVPNCFACPMFSKLRAWRLGLRIWVRVRIKDSGLCSLIHEFVVRGVVRGLSAFGVGASENDLATKKLTAQRPVVNPTRIRKPIKKTVTSLNRRNGTELNRSNNFQLVRRAASANDFPPTDSTASEIFDLSSGFKVLRLRVGLVPNRIRDCWSKAATSTSSVASKEMLLAGPRLDFRAVCQALCS